MLDPFIEVWFYRRFHVFIQVFSQLSSADRVSNLTGRLSYNEAKQIGSWVHLKSEAP